MGRIEAKADLSDDLSPKIAQTAQNVDAAVGKMKGDFADLERSTTASFGEMVGAFGTGQIAADLFRSSVQAVRQFVDEASTAYVDHNRVLRDAGEAYDDIVDKMDEQGKVHEKFMQNVGEQASGWKMLISDIRAAIEEMGNYLILQGKMPKALKPGSGPAADSTGFVTGNSSISNTFFDNQGNANTFMKLTPPFADDATRAATEAKYAEQAERAARAAEREARAAERTEAARVRAMNKSTVAGINAQLHQFRGARFDFSDGDPKDETNPFPVQKPSRHQESDPDRNLSPFAPFTADFRRKMEEDQKKFADSIKAGFHSMYTDLLFDTANFGKDFVGLIKQALAGALEKALIGDISASAGGPLGKILGGIFGIKDARTGFETQVQPELQRATARGKL